jgi:hypothetical protein
MNESPLDQMQVSDWWKVMTASSQEKKKACKNASNSATAIKERVIAKGTISRAVCSKTCYDKKLTQPKFSFLNLPHISGATSCVIPLSTYE